MKNITTLLVLILFTAGMAVAQNNDASIDQVGDLHDADIEQLGSSNDAFILQTANEGREGDDVSTATVTQEGDDNYVNLRQRAFFGDNEAKIVQIGVGNRVQGTDEYSAFYQNHGLNILDVYMEGNDNVLYSLRGEAQKNVNTFLLDIMGNENTVGMLQEFGLADIDVEGSYNIIKLDQKSGQFANWSTATVDIFGDDNTVDVFQRNEGNQAVVDIDGSNNSAYITQN
ncbi:curlin repeat-containing protein [Natronogracilivirga saccharolytica]|uniref:Curlin associated repeat-containing protein n=1 Tax=Natronogracilivirga saccharolytica TaxID=2812953 RepID=A0A8J7UWM4_9BACT|nr:curlin repeat-containing protein [Natronogracilivirga saccharolytica]MBP3193831.1 hypothetical protein [Natronogracilivirga saccharolytica]